MPHTEQPLRDGDAQFRQLVEHIREVFWLGSPDWGTVHYISPAYEEVWGRPCSSLYDKPMSWLDSVHLADRETVRLTIQHWTETQNNGPLVFPEYRIQRSDGTCRRILARAFPILDDAGQIVRIAGIAEDITAYKETQENLDQVFDLTGYVVCVIDMDGHLRRINQSFARHVGFSEAELLQNPLLDFIHPDDQARTQAMIQETLPQGIDVFDFENRFHCKDGSYKWLSWAAHPVVEKNLFIAIASDISERKHNETAIHAIVSGASSRCGPAFFDDMALQLGNALQADYILIGELTEENKASVRTIVLTVKGQIAENVVYELKGTPCEDVVGQKVCSHPSGVAGLFPDDSLLLDMQAEAYVGVPLFDSKHRPLGIVAALYCCPLMSPAFTESILQVFSTRISSEIERTRAAITIAHYQEQLRALASQLTLSEERERMRLATELHDGISQIAAITKMKVEERMSHESNGEFVSFLKEIQTMLDGLLNDTRSLTKNLGTGVQQDFKLDIAIEEWLHEEIEVKYHIKTDVQGHCNGWALDNNTRILLFRAVRELSVNVVKHAQAQRICVKFGMEDSHYCIQVADDGIGIQAQERKLAPNLNDGFGLFSIQERLAFLGGSMTIQSEPGQGTKITLQIT
ncbi:MAG: PAS domain-containing protein [Phycisphaeraceae bacterium]|nr:PAS domain-containing protein [Phycisphaeraceae bacterium]